MKKANQYYLLCHARLKEDPEAFNYLTSKGISEETIEKFNIGFDPDADPSTEPFSRYMQGENEEKKYKAPRIIYPCNDSFYIAESIDPETPYKFRTLNPKGSKTALFNTIALYDEDNTVFLTAGPLEALRIIEAGKSAVSYNKFNRALLDQLKKDPIKKSFVILGHIMTDPEQDNKLNQLKRDLEKLNYKSIVYYLPGSDEDIIKDTEQLQNELKEAIKSLEFEKLDSIEKFVNVIQTESYKPYKTELKFFDDLLSGGVIKQSLLIIMAAPGSGKTSLCAQIAEAMASNKKSIIYLNFEMSREQMLARAISARCYKGNGIDKSAAEILQGYKWTDPERDAILKVIEEYHKTNYEYIQYNPPGTTNDLNGLLAFLESIGKEATQNKVEAPAIIIDYIHLISGTDNLQQAEIIKQAVKGLKDYAIKYNTFVIAISATNRETNKTKKMSLESGRDTSNLEYTADYVVGLREPNDDENIKYFSTMRDLDKKPMVLELYKNRLGEQNKISAVLFDGKHTIFYDVK